MIDVTDLTSSHHGGLVAFEGLTTLTSAQIQLLPRSPRVLTLPSIRHYMPKEETGTRFKALEFVRAVHDAAKARNEEARQFLKGANPFERRLVFLNGGTVSAYALCISTISQNETRGDVDAAEAVFKTLLRGGIKGVAAVEQQSGWNSIDWRQPSRGSLSQQHDVEETLEDPSTKAMRAAEALDRETAALQEDMMLDLTTRPRPRSMSLPLYGFSDDPNDATPYLILGAVMGDARRASVAKAPEKQNDTTKEKAEPGTLTDRSNPVNIVSTTPSRSQHHSPSYPQEGDESAVFQAKKGMAVRNAVLVDTSSEQRPTSFVKSNLQRTRSLGRFHATYRTKVHDRRSVLELSYRPPDLPSAPVTSTDGSFVAEQSLEGGDQEMRSLPFTQPRKATMRRMPPKLKIIQPMLIQSAYADKGTDTAALLGPVEEDKATSPASVQTFEPVLPFVEDMVIHFKDDTPNVLLHQIIHNFKVRQYPILEGLSGDPHCDEAEEPLAFPATPTSPQGPMFITPQPGHIDSPPWGKDEEYDPFAPQTYRRSAIHAKFGRRPSDFLEMPPRMASTTKPPTPMNTPPPPKPDVGHKFLSIQVSPGQTPISTQNSLRSVLESYYPSDSDDLKSATSYLLPGIGELWKPLFDKVNKGVEKRNFDLILAIGGQEGVDEGYRSVIAGQVEKIGGKPTGESRSGRVDIRYLLSNALQLATAGSSATVDRERTEDHPVYFATLAISQLDLYLRNHPSVRFLLLEYPPEQFNTVLAIQELMGSDVIKIAGIIQSSDVLPGPKGTLHRTRSQSPLASSNSTGVGKAHFSKANYLLASSATDAEITTFLSAVWKTLIDTSPFYKPEQTPLPVPAPSTRKIRPRKDLSIRTAPLPSPTYNILPPPTPRSLSARQRISSIAFQSPSSPPSSPLPDTPTHHNRSRRADSPAPSAHSKASAAETTRTAATTVRSSAATAARRAPPPGDKARSLLGIERQPQPQPQQEQLADVTSVFSDSDSDFDLETERRLMPMFTRSVGVGGSLPLLRKGNSRKALKWLGLA